MDYFGDEQLCLESCCILLKFSVKLGPISRLEDFGRFQARRATLLGLPFDYACKGEMLSMGSPYY